MHFGGESFYYHPPEGTQGYDGQGWEFTDEELLAEVRGEEEPQPPAPTGPNPHPPELIHDQNDAIAVCTSPDVCKTPVGSSVPPIPYMVVGRAGDDSNYAGTVLSNGLIVKKWDSQFTTTYGDEPGTAKGVRSGTVGDVVEPTSHSPVVRVEGQWLIRHRDTCTLNNGNCPGEYIHVKSTEVDAPPDGNDEQDRTGFGEEFYRNSPELQTLDRAADRLGEYLHDRSLIGDDLKSVWEAVPTIDEAVDFAGDVGTGLYNAGEAIITDPLGTAGSVWDWGAGALSDMWNSGAGAYERGGAEGFGGWAAAGVIGLVNPGRKAGMAGDVVEGAADLSRVERRIDRDGRDGPERRESDEETERRTEEDGGEGARSTRRVSLREQYLGRTPGKNSRTGQEVRERMREEGTLRTNRRGQDEFLDESGTWRPVDSDQTHMGHHPVDAVDWWNSTGRYLGAKSPEVRRWMLDSKNYRFEWGPLNSARGGASRSRYLPPAN